MLKWLERKFRPKKQSFSVSLPPNGRSSIEEPSNIMNQMAGFMAYFDGISPVIPFDYLEFLVKVAIVNPDISHAIKNWINLANNGHNLIIEASSDRAVEAAQERLNYQAQHIYERSAGVDGLINHYLYQIAVTGALSSEDEIQADKRGVERVIIVPTRKIRFKFENNEYQPYQLSNTGELIPLNPETYRYYAYQVIENSPYAKPPILAVIEPVLRQRDMHDNLKYMMRKFGLLGLVAMSLTPPPKKPNETEEEYRQRLDKYLSDTLDSLARNYYKGLMVKYDDQKLEHYNITGEARGAKDLMIMNEEQMASGIGVDSSILGRSYHSTETFANVMYMFMVRDANNYRRLVKRRMERTYWLDILLQGIPINDITLSFNENPARDPQSEAQAENVRINTIIKKVEKGMIDPDTGAQEAGYSEWYDQSRIETAGGFNLPFAKRPRRKIIFQYNQQLHRYEFNRPTIYLSTKKWQLASDDEVRRKIEKWAKRYLQNIRGFIEDQREQAIQDIVQFLEKSSYYDFRNENDFAERLYLFLRERYPEAFRRRDAQDAIKNSVSEIYEYYRVKDRSAWPFQPEVTFTMDHLDQRTMAFMQDIDRFYLSKFIRNQNVEKSVLHFLEEQFLEHGEGLFGRTSPEVLNEFQSMLRDRLVEIEDWAAQRIINTSVQRMRNWGNLAQLVDAGYEYAEIFNPDPQAEICVYMAGKIIPIAPAYQAMQDTISLTPEAFEQRLKPLSPDYAEAKGIDAMAADGEAVPPYHPNCHTRMLAAENPDLQRQSMMSMTEVYRFIRGQKMDFQAGHTCGVSKPSRNNGSTQEAPFKTF